LLFNCFSLKEIQLIDWLSIDIFPGTCFLLRLTKVNGISKVHEMACYVGIIIFYIVLFCTYKMIKYTKIHVGVIAS